ncbi:MAG: hypothetical protein IT200_18475 [Thermoleophilia bacterium]|nr:hypothetical protein [Thermoleophilia bacterium]
MKRLIPSMFHRRLVLIGAAYGIAVVALGAQLGRLTLVRGQELLAQAEARLRYAQWVPTTRGRILDRKGRVLAHDRACYHVAVDYRVISGAWAREQARAFAQRSQGTQWRRLPAAERDALVASYLPAFERHLDGAWGRLALATGVPPGELAEDRRVVIETVEAMAAHLRKQWRAQFMARHAATGRQMEPDDVRRLERQTTQDIAEQNAPHIVVRAVADEIAFELLRLAEQRTMLDPAGTGDSGDAIEVPLLPGLVVEDGAAREYPFESVVVDVDQHTLPLPLRADGRRSVTAVGVLADILGWMGTPTDTVLDRRRELRETDHAFARRTTGPGLDGQIDLGQYQPGDLAGTRGIEARFEADLRGLRGQRIVRRDTDERIDVPPAPGRDVALTIDAMLQARVQAAMSPELGLARVQAWHGNHAIASGTPLVGAAVVLDVDTGEILAMVSTPGVTQSERRRAEGRVQERVRREAASRTAHEADPRVPIEEYDHTADPDAMLRFNRAVGAAYAPGSVAKVVVLLEAVRQGVYRLTERIACTGHLLERDPNQLRCWIFKRFNVTHNDTLGHSLSAPEALTASCNVFFYTLGRRLGPEGISQAYTRWGVGQGHDFGLGPVARGVVNVDDTGQAILAGIGQGPVTWTPMHAADALATIARGGIRIAPRLTPADAPEGGGDPVDLGLDPAAVRAVIAGLEGAVHDAEHGTGHHITFTVASDGVTPADGSAPGTREIREEIFNVPGVRVVGKTGTATAGAIELRDARGRIVLDDSGNAETVVPDHSWYVALVGPESGPEGGRLKYAIAVMMENAGSGGKVSGPICNQIVRALVDEGYLPSAGGAP